MNKLVYTTGTTIRVSTVANVNPDMMVTAIAPKNLSKINGDMPSTVVSEAMIMGRSRLTEESTTERYGSLPVLISLSI